MKKDYKAYRQRKRLFTACSQGIGNTYYIGNNNAGPGFNYQS